MLVLSPSELEKKQLYRIMTGVVAPRPIAFVTTKGKNGVVNAAPFSYFNMVTSKPPRVSIVVNHSPEGIKDTGRNIIETKQFVVNIVTEDILESVNECSRRLPPEESEIERTSLNLVDSLEIKVPQIKESQVRFECVLDARVPFESADMFIGEVVKIHIDPMIYNGDKVNVLALSPILRLDGNNYGKIGNVITLERPK